MRIEIDRSICLGSGQCAYMQPTVFRLGDDGLPVVLVEHPEGDELRLARDAEEQCPSQAITLVED